MSGGLDRLAEMAGIEVDYLALSGETQRVSDDAKRAVLEAMGIPAGDEDEIAAALASLSPVELGPMQAPPGVSCFVPDWLREGRCWGATCQVYSLRSERNWGIGDFEDLARFAEIAAEAGADFVGVNPLHALFLAAPERDSPFSPSNRLFLNPLYIAVDKTPGCERLADALQPPPELRANEFIEYRQVASLKRKALDRLFRIQSDSEDESFAGFEHFCLERGQALYLHALFEALSEAMSQQGQGATWHGWPDEYRHPGTDSVRAFAEEQESLVVFHCWLQWIADRQLAAAQARALAAGMRIGLYLDLAVGVAPDGSATWSDRSLTAPKARIGAPPDYFNSVGQDWGLAPLSPASLVARDFEPYRASMDIVVRNAGAIRIDHAMSLYRLFWIAEGFSAADGAYVRYPFTRMLNALAAVSQARRTIVIGEDLGVVPSGFREVMRQVEIQSYRVLFFEKREDFFLPPEAYPCEALACVTTHDLHTLAGWWSGRDIDVRCEIGMVGDVEVPLLREARAHERRRLLGLLADKGLLPDAMRPVMRGEAEAPRDLPESVALALHRLVARAPSRLFAVPAEDLTGAMEQVNVPGTMDEHANWRRKLSIGLEDLASHGLFRAITAALREERPRPA
ncbi:MAG: 4-alpha-glucanotransferase [Rhizobiales bacterium]|nr:4-alpha-glucanotransferase [Hyphomicrobiales bacterium]